ncbi:sulfatase-like hydrolase/transferase [Fulvivirgaceae bacterium PWU20]|uniref:Sulfatase-like hydrolase/transferase n=2 Tax=Chryseosolibacter indicus TaxID=2782351 RepID=A0ABS5VSQ9_9BACT|nr:sulfatase-like hydrolase/transferase [Chryseosolibacter indicus]
MLLFSLCRMGFYLYNTSFFPDMSMLTLVKLMLAGLRFDLVSVLYVNMLFIVLMVLPFKFRFNYGYQEFLKYTFFITNGFALALNVSDFIYYKFTLRRTTADVVKQFENEQNLEGLFFQFLVDYWYALLFWLLLIVVMVVLYNRVRIWGPQTKNSIVFYISSVLLLAVIAFLTVGGIRGGFRHSTRPITLSNAGEYVSDPRDISIVLNTPFTIIRTIGRTKVQPVNFFSSEEVEKIYSPVHYPKDSLAFEKKNVVVLILESFSKEFFGTFNKEKDNGTYKGYTPFLDSLIEHSLTYEYSFANGRKSIDGLPSVISSIPSLGVPYFLSPYSGNKINSLASLLKTKGYHTSFFHGAPNGSMGFKAFMNLAGVDSYYGMTEYDNDDDFDGLWGIWDDKFLDFYASKLNEFPQPFMSSFFSVSSHHPFKIPDVYKDKFKEGRVPISKCIEYTDYSLKQFFAKASKMPWYQNTLFVITADHTSSNAIFDDHRTAWGFFSVPVIFFTPDQSLSGRKQEIIQQIDIMPSVLGHLHYDKPYFAYGRNVFNEEVEPFAFNYKDNIYQLFERDFLLIFDGKQSLGLYNFKQDKMITNNLLKQYPDVVQRMEVKMKAFIQQYNNRMIEDKLTVTK